jgi:hypothetical protein
MNNSGDFMRNIQRLLTQMTCAFAMLGFASSAFSGDVQSAAVTMKVPVKITNLPNNIKPYVHCMAIGIYIPGADGAIVDVPIPVVNGNYQGTIVIPMHADIGRDTGRRWQCYLTATPNGLLFSNDDKIKALIDPKKPQVAEVSGDY